MAKLYAKPSSTSAMTANKTKWVRLGDYIEEVDERNREGIDYPFCGINKDKTFMPTVADTNNLDNTKYKLVTQDVFVFSGMQTGRDVCIRIALQGEDKVVLISPAYTTFRIKRKHELIPSYLYIQFVRFEMDRYGWFLSDGSIRSNLDWDRFCDIRIPLPSMEVQRDLVAMYEGLKRLAEDNEALIAPLTEACQAFIVDCKRQYRSVSLGDYIEEVDERNKKHIYREQDCVGVNIDKELNLMRGNLESKKLELFKLVRPHLFVYNPRGSRKLGLGFNNTKRTFITTFNNEIFRVKRGELLSEYLYILLSRKEFDRDAEFRSWGSSTEVFLWSALCETIIPLPPLEVQQSIVNLYHCIEEAKRIAREARERLGTLCPALVQYAIEA